jgi:mono/diheme cytochrome c family protein
VSRAFLIGLSLVAALLFRTPLALAAPEFGHIFTLLAHHGEVLVASERGLFVVAPGGAVSARSLREGGFQALTTDPTHPGRLIASTETAPVLQSDDGGRQWTTVSSDAKGPFAMLAAGAKGDGQLYGVSDALYASKDGGRHWQRVGNLPEKLIHLSASAVRAQRLYAGTMTGLELSDDGGAHWTRAGMSVLPTPLIQSMADGSLYGFEWGRGLMRADEQSLAWTALNNRFGGQALLRIARTPAAMVALSNAGKLFTSEDDGRTWMPLGGYPVPKGDAAKRGEALFAKNCQACHGDHGIGESPQAGVNQSLAPALDETMHAWHHTDDQIKTTILEGLPAPSRMQGWSGRLSEADADDLIAYMKSQWDERALNCQGPRHMAPECRR